VLTPHQTHQSEGEARNRRRERRLWDQPNLTPSLGCSSCPEVGLCGGLHTKFGLFDCMGHCCQMPDTCSKVCRLKAADFTQRVREIGGFDLGNTPRSLPVPAPALPVVVPVVYHGNNRERLYGGPAVALSLYRVLRRATGEPRFVTESELRAEFRLSPDTVIILTGTDQDPPLERWWRYGVRRPEIIATLRRLGVKIVTTPNYSLFANSPRWDDMHSMKRIALVNSEFLLAGLASALHVNARSDTDVQRWIRFVSDREEISHLAYEFTTGSGRAERREIHAHWLSKIAKSAGRPLTLIVRGGTEVLPILAEAFHSLIVLETSAFMKTMKRRRAVVDGNAGLSWEHVPTAADSPLDDVFEHNVRHCVDCVRLQTSTAKASLKRIAA